MGEAYTGPRWGAIGPSARTGDNDSMITVRLAVPEDGPGVARVQVEGWQQHYRGLIPDAYLDGLDREIREPIRR